MERPVFNIEVVDPASQESRNYRGYSLKTPFWPRGQITSQKPSEVVDAGIMEPVAPPKRKLKLKLKPKAAPVPEAAPAPAPKKKEAPKISKATVEALKAYADMRKQKKEAKAEPAPSSIPMLESKKGDGLEDKTREELVKMIQIFNKDNLRRTGKFKQASKENLIKIMRDLYESKRQMEMVKRVEEKPKGRVRQMAREIEKKIEKSGENINFKKFKFSNDLELFARDGEDSGEEIKKIDAGWIRSFIVLVPGGYTIDDELKQLLTFVAEKNNIKTPIQVEMDSESFPNSYIYFKSKDRIDDEKDIKISKEEMIKYITKNKPTANILKQFKDIEANKKLTAEQKEKAEPLLISILKSTYKQLFNDKKAANDEISFRSAITEIYDPTS